MKHLLLALALVPAALAGGELPAQNAVTPVKIAEVPGYCEGIVFDRAGLAYVSDTQHGTIYTVTLDGTTALWANTTAPNGHKILTDGTHLVCDKGAVLHLDAAGKKLRDASAEGDGKPPGQEAAGRLAGGRRQAAPVAERPDHRCEGRLLLHRSRWIGREKSDRHRS